MNLIEAKTSPAFFFQDWVDNLKKLCKHFAYDKGFDSKRIEVFTFISLRDPVPGPYLFCVSY